jgi:hypothetical protein
MSLVATENSGPEREIIEAGVHIGRCFQVIDLGTQETAFGKKHQVLLGWELPGLRTVIQGKEGAEDREVPRVISKRYTVSLSDKANLRADLEAWRGRKFTAEELAGFDLANVVGKACQIQIVHAASKTTTKTYANIQAIMGVPKGLALPAPEMPQMTYDIEKNGKEVPESMPKWLVDEIAKCEEWATLPSPAGTPAGAAGEEDDIPF